MAEDQSNLVSDNGHDESCAHPRVIDCDQLFQGRREIWIDHEGVRYRLRITRRNKLILQK